jgi:hypothetical protein
MDFVLLNSDLAEAKFVVVVSSLLEVAKPFHLIILKPFIFKLNRILPLSSFLSLSSVVFSSRFNRCEFAIQSQKTKLICFSLFFNHTIIEMYGCLKIKL